MMMTTVVPGARAVLCVARATRNPSDSNDNKADVRWADVISRRGLLSATGSVAVVSTPGLSLSGKCY